MWGSMKRTGGFGAGGIGSGSFGVNARDLPLTKEEYFDLLELLVFYVMVPSRGFKETKR